MSDLKTRKVDLSYIQMLSVGGEAMNLAFEENLRTFLREHNCSVIPLKGYGLTETTATVTMETIDANALCSVGIPFALCNMKVVDTDSGEELPYNTQGEICLSSPGIMQEYYQNQLATDEVIEVIDGEKWLHTGDIGYISEDGLLFITGRIKRIITCREGLIYYKVFPLLLENQLVKIPGVHEICIVGRPDEAAANVLVAYVVPTEKEQYSNIECAIREYCSSNFQTYECPVAFMYMDALPRTLLGKVDYRKLEEMAKEKSK